MHVRRLFLKWAVMTSHLLTHGVCHITARGQCVTSLCQCVSSVSPRWYRNLGTSKIRGVGGSNSSQNLIPWFDMNSQTPNTIPFFKIPQYPLHLVYRSAPSNSASFSIQKITNRELMLCGHHSIYQYCLR